MEINVDENVHFQALNRIVRESKDTDITINGVVGQAISPTASRASALS